MDRSVSSGSLPAGISDGEEGVRLHDWGSNKRNVCKAEYRGGGDCRRQGERPEVKVLQVLGRTKLINFKRN